jgi:alginate O-acetyltransferase complex protein AlgI
VTILAFVFFRADDLAAACRFIGHMFVPSGGDAEWAMFMSQLTPMYLIMLAAAIVFSAPVIPALAKKAQSSKRAGVCEVCSYAVTAVMFLLCVITLSSASYNPFIYFRF